MKRFGIFSVLLLAACTTKTPAEIGMLPVDTVVTSSKPPAEFALCFAESLKSGSDLRNLANHYWVLMRDPYGTPISRWDFVPISGGTRAELHSTHPALLPSGMISAIPNVRACA